MDELKVVYYVFVSMYLCTNVLFQTTRDAGVGGGKDQAQSSVKTGNMEVTEGRA